MTPKPDPNPTQDPQPAAEAEQEGKEKIDFVKLDKEKREQTAKETREKVQAKLEDVSKGLPDGRIELVRDVMADIITGDAIGSITGLWEKAADEFAKANPDNLKELANITRPYLERLQEVEKMAIRYIEILTSTAEGGQATPEALLKMRDSQNVKAITLAKILEDPSNPAAREAVKYVFKMKTQGTKESEGYKEVIAYLSGVFDKNYIEQCLTQGPGFSSEQSSIGWFIISFLPETGEPSKEAFIKDIKAKHSLTDAQLKAFLKAGCTSGAISVNLASKFEGIKFDAKEEKELAVAYQAQNDFMQRANQFVMPAYGSENQFLKMFTLKNILLLVAQAAAGVSVGGTILAGIFKGGALKSPEKLLETLTSKSVLVGAGVIAGVEYLKNPKPGTLTPKEERETMAKRKTSSDLAVVLNSNRGWNELLTGNGAKGSEIFGEYVLQYCMKGEKDKILDEPNPEKINLASFRKWLLSRQKEGGGERYSDFADKILGSEKEGFKIKGKEIDWETNNYDLQRLANSFFVWKIGGKETQTQLNTAMQFAQSAPSIPEEPKTA